MGIEKCIDDDGGCDIVRDVKWLCIKRERSRDDGYTDSIIFFFQAEDGIRDLVRTRGLGDVYKRRM